MGINGIAFEKDRYHQHPGMVIWCEENFGRGCWINEQFPKTWKGIQENWTIHMMFGRTSFAFRNDRDFTAFMMRWA